MGKLTPAEVAVLRFEGQPWPSGARKEAAMADLLGMTPNTYYQVLNGLLDREEALADSPALVSRLRRLREQRAPAPRRREGMPG